jgi:hypothetical protein
LLQGVTVILPILSLIVLLVMLLYVRSSAKNLSRAFNEVGAMACVFWLVLYLTT